MQPLPHQRDGVAWLSRRRTALLADEMGLGKTVQVVWACNAVKAQRIIVICPAIARNKWVDEWQAATQDDLPAFALLQKSETPLEKGLTALSYDALQSEKLVAKIVADRIDVLVLDEAHYCKNPDSKRTKIVYQTIAKLAKRIWCLTGTPTPNYPHELWPMLRTLFPKALDGMSNSYDAFIKRFCTGYYDGYAYRVTGAKNIDELRSRIQPYMLRRRKKEVIKLPPLNYEMLYVDEGVVDWDLWFEPKRYGPEEWIVDEIKTNLTELERTLYRVHKGTKPADYLESLSSNSALTQTRRFVGMAKCDGVMEAAKKIVEKGEKVVIFCWHRTVVQEYQLRCDQLGWKPLTIYGATPPKRRRRALRRFARYDNHPVFIGHIISAGTAIDLISASHVIMAEMDWVPANNAQAVMRVHRYGQTKPVNVHVAALRNCIDVKISRVLRDKADAITRLYDPRLEDILA